MFRNNFIGGDGWIYHPMTIEINDYCLICGKKRGTPIPFTFIEDDEWYTLDKWDNECGHIDKYKDCYFESLELKK